MAKMASNCDCCANYVYDEEDVRKEEPAYVF